MEETGTRISTHLTEQNKQAPAREAGYTSKVSAWPADRMGSFTVIRHEESGEDQSDEDQSDEELWSPSVIKMTVSVLETSACGTLYIDPGGGYGARQLTFCSTSGGGGQHKPPAASLGLSWKWPAGRADGLPALWELLHELGHGLHLLLSSQPTGGGDSGAAASDAAGARLVLKHFGGLHLPLDILEVPSMLMEKLAMHPLCLQVSGKQDMCISDSTGVHC